MSYPSPYPIPRRIALSVGLLLVRWARQPAGPDSVTVDRSSATAARVARPAAVPAHEAAPAAVTVDRTVPAVAAEVQAVPAVVTTDNTVPGVGHARTAGPETHAVTPSAAAHARDVADRERAIRQFEVDRQVAAERSRAEHRALSWPGHP